MHQCKLGIGVLLSLFFFSAQGSNPIDSLPIWEKRQDFLSICRAADHLLANKYKQLDACDGIRLLTEASSAAIDLFEPDKSLRYAQEGRRLTRKCPDSLIGIQSVLREAIAQNMLGNMDLAVALTDDVVAFARRHDNDQLLISAYTNLGMMLNKVGEFKQARSQFENALARIKKHPENRNLATTYLNISLCYLNLGNPKEGLIWVDSALWYAQRSHTLPLVAHCYGLMSSMYQKMGNYDAWLATLDSAITTSLQTGNENQAVYGMLDKFAFFNQQKRYDEALRIGSEAMQILERGQQKPLIRNAYQIFYKVYKGLGKQTQALAYLEKYTLLKDSLDNVDFKNQVHELNLKYEVAEKDKELLEKNLALKTSHLWLSMLLSATLFFAGLTYLYFWRMKTHQRNILDLFQKERAMEKEISWLRQLIPSRPETPHVPAQGEGEDLPPSTQLIMRAQHLMSAEKPYLNPDFSRQDLAHILGTNKNYLSQALNEAEDGGFRSFINNYRIENAKSILWNLARQSSEIPVSEIWRHTGFSSNQAFYRIFKGATQLTPKEYLDQVVREIQGK